MHLLLITKQYNNIKILFPNIIQENIHPNYTIITIDNSTNFQDMKSKTKNIFSIDNYSYIFGLIEEENYNYAFYQSADTFYDKYYYNDYDDYEDEIEFGSIHWIKSLFSDFINDIEMNDIINRMTQQ